jgi:hypothetical protein
MKSELNPDTRNLSFKNKRFVYSLNYEQNLLFRYLMDKTIESLPEITDKYMNIFDLERALNNFEIREVQDD